MDATSRSVSLQTDAPVYRERELLQRNAALCSCSCVRPPLWSSGQFLVTYPEVPASIPGFTRFSEK
jgi:hypothetical protein